MKQSKFELYLLIVMLVVFSVLFLAFMAQAQEITIHNDEGMELLRFNSDTTLIFRAECDDTPPPVCIPEEEVCDGVDNDCDGVIDNPPVCDPTPEPDRYPFEAKNPNGSGAMRNGYIYEVLFPPGWMRIYGAIAEGVNKNWPIQVNMEDKYQGDGLGDYDMIIKYAGKHTVENNQHYCESPPPTVDDYKWVLDDIANGGAGCHIFWNGKYVDSRDFSKVKPREDLYYCLQTGSFEFVSIKGVPDQPHGCYYVLVYNTDFTDKINLSFTDADAPLDKW